MGPGVLQRQRSGGKTGTLGGRDSSPVRDGPLLLAAPSPGKPESQSPRSCREDGGDGPRGGRGARSRGCGRWRRRRRTCWLPRPLTSDQPQGSTRAQNREVEGVSLKRRLKNKYCRPYQLQLARRIKFACFHFCDKKKLTVCRREEAVVHSRGWSVGVAVVTASVSCRRRSRRSAPAVEMVTLQLDAVDPSPTTVHSSRARHDRSC